MSLSDRWFGAIRGVLDEIQRTQSAKIEGAAEMIVDSVTSGGALHIHDTGHLVQREAVHRAGGLLMMTPLDFSFSVNNPVRETELRKRVPARGDRLVGIAGRALDASNVREGDVLIIGTVSGRNALPIDLCIEAQARGVKVIAVTSVAYSSSVSSTHPSGKRLFEVADVTIDNCGVPGDAILEVEGLDTRACPTSGIAAATIIWALCAAVIEKLLARGLKPHVFRSVNLDDGAEFNARAEAQYKTSGV